MYKTGTFGDEMHRKNTYQSVFYGIKENFHRYKLRVYFQSDVYNANVYNAP